MAGSITPVHRKPRIVLGACGCAAALDFPRLCRTFLNWAEVKAVGTPDGFKYVEHVAMPVGLSLLIKDDWKNFHDPVLHRHLAAWADALVIAPLSANTLSKIDAGLCDNLLTDIVRAWDCGKPLFVAPAMTYMTWKNTITKKSIESIRQHGIKVIGPAESGGMAEIYSIVDKVIHLHSLPKEAFQLAFQSPHSS
ncbi:hypothetical protein ABKV19_021728 [Rosa sericea]